MRRVLLIDDDDSIREVAVVALEVVGGWDVLAAGSGQDGLRLAALERPDAILLDVMMPGMDGPTTLSLLRQDPRTQEIPVIFLTAKLQAAEQRRWDDLEVAGVLAKPFDPMLLPTQIADLLGWT